MMQRAKKACDEGWQSGNGGAIQPYAQVTVEVAKGTYADRVHSRP